MGAIHYALRHEDGWVFGPTEEDVLERCDDDGFEPEGAPVALPTKKEVCGRCRGEGKHDHPAFSNGITSSEWAEWDADEREDYRRGVYDVPCEVCHGLRVVDVIDEEVLERRDPALLEALRKHEDDEADYQRMCEAERRMGA